VINDISAGKNPAEEMKKEKTGYKELFDKTDTKKDNVRNLLSAYLAPKGEEANTLLGKDASTKYRGELKPLIKEHLQKELGMTKITSISVLATGETEIRGTKDRKEIGIQLINNEEVKGGMKADIVQYQTDKTTGGEEIITAIDTDITGKPITSIKELGEKIGEAQVVKAVEKKEDDKKVAVAEKKEEKK